MKAVLIHETTPLVVNDNVLNTLATIDIGDLDALPDRVAIYVDAVAVTGSPTSVTFSPFCNVSGLEAISAELAMYATAAVITNDGGLLITPGIPGAYTPLFFPSTNSLVVKYQGSGCDGSNYFTMVARVYAYYNVR